MRHEEPEKWSLQSHSPFSSHTPFPLHVELASQTNNSTKKMVRGDKRKRGREGEGREREEKKGETGKRKEERIHTRVRFRKMLWVLVIASEFKIPRMENTSFDA